MASDNFTRTNEDPIASPWSAVTGFGTLRIVSNQLANSAGANADSAAIHTSTVTSSRVKIAVVDGGITDGGPIICMTAGSGTGYFFANNSAGRIAFMTLPGFTTIAEDTSATDWVVNDEVRLYRDSGDLVGTVNGGEVLRFTDSTFTTGNSGAFQYSGVIRFGAWTDDAGGGGTVHTEVLEDAVAVADGMVASAIRARIMSSLLDITEGSLISSTAYGIVMDDSLAVGDESVLFYRRNRMLESFIGITDESLASVVGQNILTRILSSSIDVNDGAIFSMIRSRFLEDTIIVSEGVVGSYITRNIVVDDEIAVTDEYLAKLIWLRVLGEDISITDEALATLVGQNVITKVLTSNIETFDEALRWMNRVRFGDSTILTTDEVVKVLLFTRELTDAIELVDSAQTAMQRFITLTDLLSVDDGFISLFISPTTVVPALVIGFDQPNIKVGGYAVV